MQIVFLVEEDPLVAFYLYKHNLNKCPVRGQPTFFPLELLFFLGVEQGVFCVFGILASKKKGEYP